MKYNDEDTLIRVIKQYYELGISQKEIAEKEYISRSTVNRLINRAVSEGYVKIRLNYPLEAHREFSARLADAFGVEAVVVPTYVDDYVLRLRDVGRALITDLLKIVQNDDILAISWGRTIEYVARLLEDFQNTKKESEWCSLMAVLREIWSIFGRARLSDCFTVFWCGRLHSSCTG